MILGTKRLVERVEDDEYCVVWQIILNNIHIMVGLSHKNVER